MIERNTGYARHGFLFTYHGPGSRRGRGSRGLNMDHDGEPCQLLPSASGRYGVQLAASKRGGFPRACTRGRIVQLLQVGNGDCFPAVIPLLRHKVSLKWYS